jgi:hypothetical protein
MNEPLRLRDGDGAARVLMGGSGLNVPRASRRRALTFVSAAAAGTAVSGTAAAATTAALVKGVLLCVCLGAAGGGLASLAISEAFTRLETPPATVPASAPRPAVTAVCGPGPGPQDAVARARSAGACSNARRAGEHAVPSEQRRRGACFGQSAARSESVRGAAHHRVRARGRRAARQRRGARDARWLRSRLCPEAIWTGGPGATGRSAQRGWPDRAGARPGRGVPAAVPAPSAAVARAGCGAGRAVKPS